jgi:pyrroloquinoline quinone biosynthesis protein E
VSERPYALLAEVTHRCPLHCPYCSNPVEYPAGKELSTEEWCRVIREAAALGVLHVGFSGGEPLARADLEKLIAASRAAGMYTNLLTSGLGLTPARATSLREAGLDSLQLSLQADTAALADDIAGTTAHLRKLAAARITREAGLPLSLNFVLHRANIERLVPMLALAETLQAGRVELANTQYYGWAAQNRAQLLPTREQVRAAFLQAETEKARLQGKIDVFYVLPDYYEDRPKPCMQGWGRRYITVNPVGEVLPCPTASAIHGLRFERVQEHPLAWIWRESDSFNQFRGTAWMQEPCVSCPRREIDFGGCRCQAALLLGEATAADPVCTLSPRRAVVDGILAEAAARFSPTPSWIPRQNPRHASALPSGDGPLL